MHRPLYLLAKASSNNLAFCLLAIVTSFEVFAQSAVGISRVGDTQERSLPQMQVLGAFSLGNVPNDKAATANLAAQRGPSDFDRTHRFVLSYTSILPQPGEPQQTLFDKLAEGWA
jgi:hypothetical protein